MIIIKSFQRQFSLFLFRY